MFDYIRRHILGTKYSNTCTLSSILFHPFNTFNVLCIQYGQECLFCYKNIKLEKFILEKNFYPISLSQHRNGFQKGTVGQFVVMSGLQCTGTETSILQCPNYGWRQVGSLCLGHARDAGVFCYSWGMTLCFMICRKNSN